MSTYCICTCHRKGDKPVNKDKGEEQERACLEHIVHCCCPCRGDGDDGNGEGPNGEWPGGGQGGNPGRPDKHTGTDNGRLDEPNPELTPGDLTTPKPPGSWSGTRPELYLPYLFMRANPGDTGARPVVGPFWESPDVLLLSGVHPDDAPPIPPELGQTAQADKPNTIYAHIWNFGQAQAPAVVVEFYWCDPSIGFNPTGAHLIAQTVTALGARGSGSAHRVVKCPVPWVPTFLNNGHECLLVRIWDIASDPLGTPAWDAKLNRHLGQRNIHVVPAPSNKARMLTRSSMRGGVHPLAQVFNAPLHLKVGPLFGMPAEVTVERAAPHAMPWLQQRTGKRGQFPAAAAPTGTPALTSPQAIGGGPPIGGAAQQHTVTGDDQQVGFTTTDAHPGPGEAHVYRVTASQGGEVFGGYTVVLMGEQ